MLAPHLPKRLNAGIDHRLAVAEPLERVALRAQALDVVHGALRAVFVRQVRLLSIGICLGHAERGDLAHDLPALSERCGTP